MRELSGIRGEEREMSPETLTFRENTIVDGVFVQGDRPRADWCSMFGDPKLDALMAQAFAGNPSLRVVEARVRTASALADAARSALYPTLDLNASAARRRVSEHDIIYGRVAGSPINQERNDGGTAGTWRVEVRSDGEALRAALRAVAIASGGRQTGYISYAPPKSETRESLRGPGDRRAFCLSLPRRRPRRQRHDGRDRTPLLKSSAPVSAQRRFCCNTVQPALKRGCNVACRQSVSSGTDHARRHGEDQSLNRELNQS
jgi:hypothetical protein